MEILYKAQDNIDLIFKQFIQISMLKFMYLMIFYLLSKLWANLKMKNICIWIFVEGVMLSDNLIIKILKIDCIFVVHMKVYI